MEIQTIDDKTLAIYIDKEELRNRSVQPEKMTIQDAAEIFRSALNSLRKPRWDSVCLEIFPGQDCVLLFARQYSGTPSFFVFNDLENLITASEFCPQDIISSLTYIDNTYVLTVYALDLDMPPAVLYEYGDCMQKPPHYLSYLEEHGQFLAGPGAVNLLQNSFITS